jgi:hypothetical protein
VASAIVARESLRAFHGDPAIKAKYIARVRQHRLAEHLTKGIGWEPETQRGCAIGCCLEAYDHSRYPIELGLPEWLARLEDAIFEGLPIAEAQAWPEAFLEAIHPGADLELVRHKLALRRIDRLIALQQSNLGKHREEIDAVIQQTIAALMQVRRCHEAEIGGDTCDVSAAAESAAWSAVAARSAAESAAWSAESAAWSAAESAAESAAWSAESAESAALAARSAAWSAAESAAWTQEASDLLALLREAH